MLVRIETWDQTKAQEIVRQRFEEARRAHKVYHTAWRANEVTLFGQNGLMGASQTTVSFDTQAAQSYGDLDAGDSLVSINYTFRYHRYLLGLMSANPPSVQARPTSADYADRKAASVADKLGNYARRQYLMQERFDELSCLVLTHGTAWMDARWDPWLGEMLEVYKSGKVLMTGDAKFRTRSVWQVLPDHTTATWADVRYVFIAHTSSREEAMSRFPKHRRKIENYQHNKAPTGADSSSTSEVDPAAGRRDTITLWEYVEKGMPWNGMAGRQVWLLDDGTLISDIGENPNPDAQLPVYPLTDVDVPGHLYGKSFVDYLVRLQDILNRLDSTVLDNIQAHGLIRMVVFDGEEETEAETNSTWQIINIKGAGGTPPRFVDPPTLMPDIYRFRQQLMEGMEALAGMNEYMFGNIKRETSGYTAQTAISAGNMVRRRLFNKYKLVTEWTFKTFLSLVQLHWKDDRKVLVTGAEGALEVAYFSGADLNGGFDIDCEYGASFSLDPEQRREQIMQLLPFLKEAGFSMQQILSMMKLNDVAGLFDMAEVTERRQMEVFEEMIAKFEEQGLLTYIAPEELEEHVGRLNAAYKFRESMAYRVLDPRVKRLIDRHILEREQWAAKPPRAGATGAPTGALAGPAAAGLTGAAAPAPDLTQLLTGGGA